MNKKVFTIDLNAAVLKVLVTESHKSYKQVAAEFGVGLSYVVELAKKNGISRQRGPKPMQPAKQPIHQVF
jgi:transposase